MSGMMSRKMTTEEGGGGVGLGEESAPTPTKVGKCNNADSETSIGVDCTSQW